MARDAMWTFTLLTVAALAGSAARPQEAARPAAVVWDERAAEHLLNRAGFGAPPREVREAVERGLEATVERLLAGSPFVEDPFYTRVKRSNAVPGGEKMSEDQRREARRRMRQADDEQLFDFLRWWVERMVNGDDPLREKTTLFWHAYFTSSQQDVKNSHEMIVQNQIQRTGALGSFGELLHEMSRSPAMLEYLDNDSSSKESPNENFARELFELFTLGEGNYTEDDVKEAARAFTGWTDRNGEFRFRRQAHDRRLKTVLGVTGRLDGDDVLAVLLDQEACGRHVAGHLIAFFEGVEPDEARLAEYGRFLRDQGYDVAAFLRRLFTDPAFYRAEAVGTRIAGPIDYLVGISRRLGIAPPPRLVLAAAGVMGQRLFFPPNVKGWEEGEAWITSATVLQRANFAGVLVGAVDLADLLVADSMLAMVPTLEEDDSSGMEALGDSPGMDEASMEAVPASMRPKSVRGELGKLRNLSRLGWKPRVSFTARLQAGGFVEDAAIVGALADELLGVQAEASTLAALTDFLARERAAAGLAGERLFDDPLAAEPLLRRLAHVILSLPEASLE